MLFFVTILTKQFKTNKIMKINKMLIAVTAMLAAVLSGCKDDETVGIDSSMPMPAEFTYDESSATSSSIMVFWDPRQAISAGATSFTVQLVKSLDGSADMYDATTSQTIQSSVTNNSVTTFDNLTKGRIFYVRIRANYPRSVFSEWTFAMADGKPARIMVGKGVVGDEVGETSTIDAKIEQISESTAIAKWSTCGYTNNDTDASYDYKLELFKDAACKDLHVSWNVTGGNISISKYGPAFIFSGLTPSTKYYFRATNTTDNVVSDVIEFTTAASQFKTLPATANEGEVILFQDFHEFLWGGDYLNKAGGYSNNGRSSATEIDAATGENPVSAEKFYICDASVEMGLFNTLGKAVPSTSLADWGQMSEPGNTKSPGIICARPGMMKMGASNYSAWLVTPELSCLTQPATIEVTFKIAPYDSDQAVVVELLDETTKSNSPIASNITAGVRTEVYRTSCGTGGWKTETVTVPNVTSTCRIAIGAGENGEGASQHRFHLDDIQLKVISYGELSAPDAPAKPTLTATDRTITATWEEVARAKTYTVEYKKTADSEWTVAAEKIAETTYTIEGLDFETQYDVRVKALIDDLASDYSEVAQIKTLAEIKQLETPQNVTAVADYGVATLTFDPVVGATDYEVYANGSSEKLVGMITNNAEKVTYKVTGLAFNTPYTFQVKAVAEGIQASELSTATESTTTSEIIQIKNNVGPTIACIGWGNYGNTAVTTKFVIQIADENGQALGTIDLTKGNYSSTASTINGQYRPTRFTFGGLTPDTKYKVRLKVVGEDDKLYSPYFEFKTEAAHVKGAKEVLYQSFDESWFGGDIMNSSAGLGPSSSYVTTPILTWEGYISNYETVLDIATNTNVSASKLPTTLTQTEESSFYGYVVKNLDFRPSHIKLGGGKAPGELTTAELGEGVLNATTPTPCTISFRVAPMSDSDKCAAKAMIVVVHADGSKTTAIENVEVLTGGDPYNYVWKDVKVENIELLSTDKLFITSFASGSNDCRYLFDELLVVAE